LWLYPRASHTAADIPEFPSRVAWLKWLDALDRNLIRRKHVLYAVVSRYFNPIAVCVGCGGEEGWREAHTQALHI
jgi:hypothetical protein